MPKVADSVDEVTVVDWTRAVGEAVGAGESLLRVETDKAIVEVPSPVDGTVLELLADVNADVSTGMPIAVIETA